MSAKRILLIGSGGAGKSTLARRLGEQTGLPVVHLDRLYWTGEWQHLDKDDFDRMLEAELEKPEWILDGNFTRTLPRRLEACDLVLYLDYPTRVCLWGVLRRILRYHGETRPDMGENCPERFDLSFLNGYAPSDAQPAPSCWKPSAPPESPAASLPPAARRKRF